MMTAGPPGYPVTEGVFSLEVRWILPGPLDLAVAQWFAAFPSEAESREDAYLLDPDMAGLSVKVRASRAREVKVFGGSPGILEPGGRVRGRLQYWRKWSFLSAGRSRLVILMAGSGCASSGEPAGSR
jgi:hypothetical protein